MVKKVNPSNIKRESKLATTPEGREQQLISEAMNLVEQRILNGTATSQETTHFLKLGTEKYRLEKEKAEEEIKLMRARTEALESAKHVEELYINAMAAFKDYSGQVEEVDD